MLTPEATQGPYYIDLDKIRSDITEGKPGVPLTLKISVVDAMACAAMNSATVDIWHADAGGVYSGFAAASTGAGPSGGIQPAGINTPTDNRTFLRGVQLTDPGGACTFKTIYPGWYPGRAVHIHVKVRVDGRAVHTGQLFFPDTLTDAVFRRRPYAAHGPRDTRNQNDNFYASAGSALSTLDPRANGDGYEAVITVGVKTA